MWTQWVRTIEPTATTSFVTYEWCRYFIDVSGRIVAVEWA